MTRGMQLLLLLLLNLCLIHGSAGNNKPPSSGIYSTVPPIEEKQDLLFHVKSLSTSPLTASPLSNGLTLHFSVVSPTDKYASGPQTVQVIPPMPPSPPISIPLSPPLSQTMPPPSPPPISPTPPVVHESVPHPHTMPRLGPSSPPMSPIIVPHTSAPLAQIIPQLAPSIPPHPPIVVPSKKSAPLPQTKPRITPSIPPSPAVVPSQKLAPLPETMPRIAPSIYPSPSTAVPSHKSTRMPKPMPRHTPTMPPTPPIVDPSHNLAPLPQTLPGFAPSVPPTDSSRKKAPEIPLPVTLPHAQAPVGSPPMTSQQNPPSRKSTRPSVAPSTLSEPAVPPISFTNPSTGRKEDGIPAASPPKKIFDHFPPKKHSPKKGSFPVLPPVQHNATRPSDKVLAPSMSSSEQPKSKQIRSQASLPSVPFNKHHYARKRATSPPLAPHYSIAPTIPSQGPVILPAPSHNSAAPSYPRTARSLAPIPSPKKSRERHQNPVLPNHGPVSAVQPPFPTTTTQGSPAPLPSPTVPIGRTKRPTLPPIYPPQSSPMKPKATLPSPVQALPPPPPNQDCTSLTCTEPLTNSPPGSPCGCVWPIKVGLRLSVALYTFFPLVSELAEEIASGVFMKQSQVRIMGANAASQQLDKTDVLIDLVPLGENFDKTTSFLTYEKFWHKQVAIKTSFFGDYDVLYVHYPGLPPSPPSVASSIDTIDGPYISQGNNARTIHPLGVDVKRKHKRGLGGSTIAIIVLSSFAAVVLCIGAVWLLLMKHGGHTRLTALTSQAFQPSLAKQSGAGGSMFGSGLSSTSLSFGSSITTYTGSARTFSAEEVERATNNFDAARILGEGGFGRVYKGILDDGTEVAIKVLKRDDQQGGREFLAEVEMLSRLHHRNLVKLIGICIEEHTRCLMYELIPNGSVESHLHGVDKEIAPLDWVSRMKIALGAARGLAYLHEDSSPHVIHRDFKSSNILLEHDFTPKVSDFGLARTALDEGNKHISTRVMGTFGYVAPEYAMTGHLLVKSDVYSYGVVLLELLTGRKPVDMSQPQGQENLVAWARPLLTSKEGLEMIIDPSLVSSFPFDSVAKVAAIASMCVQPEVSHRPFMGEVVQALKLVCNECDEAKEAESESCGQEDLSVADIDTRTSTGSGQLGDPSRARCSDYDSVLEGDRALSASYIFTTSEGFGRQASGSFRRHSSSGPLRTGRGRQFWQRIRGLSRGSVSEHGVAFRLWAGSH